MSEPDQSPQLCIDNHIIDALVGNTVLLGIEFSGSQGNPSTYTQSV